MYLNLRALFAGLGMGLIAAVASAANLWSDADPSRIATTGTRFIVPEVGRTMALNYAGMTALLQSAPLERDVAAPDSPFELELPLPEGGYGRFRVVESPIMEAGLAKRYPMLKTYLGQGIDNPTATVRFDLTVRGFRAQVIANTHTTYIEPYQTGDVGTYVVFNKSDYRKQGAAFTCGVTGEEIKSVPNLLRKNNVVNISSGGSLRTYRLALAATGEYTAVLGGTVLDGLSGQITTMNRVNGIYERELGVRMVLVANNDLIVYTNGTTDPYTNGNGNTMLGENQSNLNTVIGNANYDIGHVFSTGGGGVAGLGVVCNSGNKGRGVTGSTNPIADAYDVDYVAHEMGHQFAGNHTFNGSGVNCSGGNRSASSAYEPGSGITIQAYAGICGNDNTQPNSEDYFHRRSLNEMLAFTTNAGTGASCGTLTTTGNNAPTVTTTAAFTIPQQTPFKLTASGTDPDGDTLTYLWEQFDVGAAANAEGVLVDAGSGPLFRSFIPTTDPTRIFPSLRYILNNANVVPATAPLPGTTTPNYMAAELLPSTNRTMNFRVTVRDNRAGGGGTNEASTAITVTTAAGPFAVTSPNTAVTWAAGSSQTITWNVAGTTAAPVSTANVEIALSVDGGYTFPYILAASTANDGTETLTIPAGIPATTQARIRVAAVGNVFFDISDTNFTITGANTAPTLTVTGSVTTRQGSPAATAVVATVSDAQDSAGSLAVSVSQVPPELTVTASNAGGNVSLTATASCSLVTPTSGNKTYPVLLTVTDSAGASTTLPVNVLVGANLIPTLGTYGNINMNLNATTTVTPSAAIADGNNNLVAASVSPTLLPGSGDGATISIAANGTVTVNTDNNTTPGTYTVRAQANDSCGAVRVRQFTVTVLPTTPVINLASSQIITGNGVIEPNECNQLNVTLTNAGVGSATGVTATLSTVTPNVTVTQPTASFADIAAGQSRTSLTPFQFSTTSSLTCGSTVNFNLTVNYTGGGSPRVIPLTFTVGTTTSVFTQNFDGVTAPALPAGWTTAQSGTTPPAVWATTTSSPDTAPNAAFTNGVATPSTNSLISPAITLPASSTGAVLTFRNAWNFEAGYDGGVLELSTDNGTTYNDVTSPAVGGSFTTGGYSGSISSSFGSPIGGQAAWTGVQSTFVTTTLQLPASLNGQTVRLRFRAAWDTSTANAGANWRIDGLSIQSGVTCPGPGTGTCGGSTYLIATAVLPVGTGTVSCTVNPVPSGGNSTCTATAALGYTFANWSGDCTGATCALTNVTSAKSVTANFTALPVLNIDDSDAPDVYSPANDGLLLMRYLLGLRGTALTQGGLLGTNARRNAAQIEAHIATYLTLFDVDGDGSTLAATDGLLVVRRLLGLSGPALTAGARAPSVRTDTDITNAIDRLKP
jgi:hypothetical protein